MADFCTKCSKSLFGGEFKPDIDVDKIFEELQMDHYQETGLCEGCGMVAIKKENGVDEPLILTIDNIDSNRWIKYSEIPE